METQLRWYGTVLVQSCQRLPLGWWPMTVWVPALSTPSPLYCVPVKTTGPATTPPRLSIMTTDTFSKSACVGSCSQEYCVRMMTEDAPMTHVLSLLCVSRTAQWTLDTTAHRVKMDTNSQKMESAMVSISLLHSEQFLSKYFCFCVTS